MKKTTMIIPALLAVFAVASAQSITEIPMRIDAANSMIVLDLKDVHLNDAKIQLLDSDGNACAAYTFSPAFPVDLMITFDQLPDDNYAVVVKSAAVKTIRYLTVRRGKAQWRNRALKG